MTKVKTLLHNLNKPLTRRQAERGVALILVMIFLSLMLLLGLATTMTSITEVGVGKNIRLATEAFNTADAGTAHAYALVKNMQGDFTTLLRGKDDTPLSGDEFDSTGKAHFYDVHGDIAAGSPPDKPMFKSSVTTIDVKTTLDGKKRAMASLDPYHFYELYVYDNADEPFAYLDVNNALEKLLDVSPDHKKTDCDQRVVIRSIGYVTAEPLTVDQFTPSKVIASAVVDIVIGLNPFPAIVSNNDLSVGGSSNITGALGGVHANDDLGFTGSGYYVEQTATWSNNQATTPDSSPGGVVNTTSDLGKVDGFNGYSDTLDIPPMTPYLFANKSDYIVVTKDASTSDRTKLTTVLGQTTFNGDTTLGVSASDVSNDNSHFVILKKDSSYSGGYKVIYRDSSDPGTKAQLGTSPIKFTSKNTGDFDIDEIPTQSDPATTLFVLGGPASNSGSGGPVCTLNGNVGSGTKGRITLLTNMNVFMTGNADLSAALSTDTPYAPPWDVLNLTVMTGRDLKFSGSASSQNIQGVLFACEGFGLTGSANLTGQVIGFDGSMEDATFQTYTTDSGTWKTYELDGTKVPKSADKYIDVSSSSVSGSFTVDHDASRGYVGSFSIVAWRQLRDFRPEVDAR
jgi:hypothetical protein